MQFFVFIAGALLAVVQPTDPHLRVHDFANLLSPSDQATLEQRLQDVERKTTAQIAVVTVPSLGGSAVEAYAHELFNSWGLGQNGLNNGVLLLVAPQERRMRIEVGYGLEMLLSDGLCGEIRDTFIVPHFQRGDYPAGILAGARQLASVLESNPLAAHGVPNSSPALARAARRNALIATTCVAALAGIMIVGALLVAARRKYSTTSFALLTMAAVGMSIAAAYFVWRVPKREQPWLWFGGAGLASAAAWGFNVQRYRRFGPHACSKCGTRLTLLSEQEDDEKLPAVARLEEELGSVDYDVWMCPACLASDTQRYMKPFTSFKKCENCGARAYKEDPQVVLRKATTSRAGRARVDGRCVACKHKTVRFVVLPMVVQTSTGHGSSSGGGSFGGGGGFGGGGSFGGGSSGGGGASGGW